MTYFLSMRKSEAKLMSERWNRELSEGKDPFTVGRISDSDREIRNGILAIFAELDDGKYGYEFDSMFGLKLYVFLRGLGMTEADAADNEIWIHLQMKVVPDVMARRWPPKENKINDKRMWSDISRLYLRAMWWYIDLLWAGDEASTEAVLAPLDISQITDRSGRGGTRRDVYRAILHVYAKVPSDQRTKGLIERVLMLNSTYCTVIEPELRSVSLEEYAMMLFREVGVDV